MTIYGLWRARKAGLGETVERAEPRQWRKARNGCCSTSFASTGVLRSPAGSFCVCFLTFRWFHGSVRSGGLEIQPEGTYQIVLECCCIRVQGLRVYSQRFRRVWEVLLAFFACICYFPSSLPPIYPGQSCFHDSELGHPSSAPRPLARHANAQFDDQARFGHINMQLTRLVVTIAAAALALAGNTAAAPSHRSDMPLPLRVMKEGVVQSSGHRPYAPLEYGL
ncbi:hypothetical protein GY45DRAFT_283968 [Cubamyces sp. BRFM 1775]|nr:hypothetical protein GY45DRAFT_283968 [Cubamyces sp. BRFM 1775]